MLTVLHLDPARSVVAAGARRDVRIVGMRRPLRPRYRAGILTVIGGFVGSPYAKELLRCTRTVERTARELTDRSLTRRGPPLLTGVIDVAVWGCVFRVRFECEHHRRDIVVSVEAGDERDSPPIQYPLDQRAHFVF